MAGLGQLVHAVLAEAPWLTLTGFADKCRHSDDALVAVVAALTARVALLGLVTTAPAQQAETAAIEGWIALPTSRLDDLRPQ